MSFTSYLLRAKQEEKKNEKKKGNLLVYQWTPCQNSMMRPHIENANMWDGCLSEF